MGKPIVAIVGRPNVGKSTLFNKLVGQRLAIVEDTPGVTRDRLYGNCEWQDHRFLLIDTGGIEPKADDVLLRHMRGQAQLAIDTADAILFVTDIRSGVTAQDQDIAAMLMRSGKPVFLVVNKVDGVGEPPMELYDFYSLGIGEPYPVSSVHGHGTGDLLEAVCACLPENEDGEDEDERIGVAVIGRPNVGKSSLVNLIPRFYDATEGTVEILGRPAADYPREALRGKVNVVMQKAQLFGGTIRSNLLWGNKNATDADLWAALETAQAAEFVKAKPLGLDEPVEQGGRNLSGGQKQRLTIARALVGKPEILILDDSASALDYATDAALRKALAALPGSLTVFIVSQRAASLQHADQIIVLDDGRMVGLGRHADLLKTCPVYEEIYASQFKKGDAQK